MQIVTQFDPLTFQTSPGSSSGGSTFNARVPNGSLLRMVVVNDSPVSMIFSFQDANNSNDIVPAKDRRYFQLYVNSPIITWSIDRVVGQLTDGISQCYITTYQPSETLVETYPTPLARNVLWPTIMQTVQFTGNSNPTITIPSNILFLGYDLSVTQMTGTFTAEKLFVQLLYDDISVPFNWYYWLSTSAPIKDSMRIPGDGFMMQPLGATGTLSVNFSGSLSTNAVGQITAYWKQWNYAPLDL